MLRFRGRDIVFSIIRFKLFERTRKGSDGYLGGGLAVKIQVRETSAAASLLVFGDAHLCHTKRNGIGI